MWADVLLFSLGFIVAIVVLLEGCWHKWGSYDEPTLMNGSYIQRRQCSKCSALDIRVIGQNLEKRDG